jgi:large subunit ribosomal protein L23
MALTDKKTKEEKEVKKPVAKKPVVKKAAPKKDEASMKDLYSDASSEKKSGTKKSAPATKYAGAYRVLVSPLVTEKAANLGSLNKYAFVVSTSANKIEVAKAVQSVYGVKVETVNIISMKGKRVTRGRIKGQRKDWKKALVTLKKGDSIQLYEGV